MTGTRTPLHTEQRQCQWCRRLQWKIASSSTRGCSKWSDSLAIIARRQHHDTSSDHAMRSSKMTSPRLMPSKQRLLCRHQCDHDKDKQPVLWLCVSFNINVEVIPCQLLKSARLSTPWRGVASLFHDVVPPLDPMAWYHLSIPWRGITSPSHSVVSLSIPWRGITSPSHGVIPLSIPWCGITSPSHDVVPHLHPMA